VAGEVADAVATKVPKPRVVVIAATATILRMMFILVRFLGPAK
jgi:hypothetical protein